MTKQDAKRIAEEMIKERLDITALYEAYFRVYEGIGGLEVDAKFEDDRQVAYFAECTPALRYLKVYKEL